MRDNSEILQLIAFLPAGSAADLPTICRTDGHHVCRQGKIRKMTSRGVEMAIRQVKQCRLYLHCIYKPNLCTVKDEGFSR